MPLPLSQQCILAVTLSAALPVVVAPKVALFRAALALVAIVCRV